MDVTDAPDAPDDRDLDDGGLDLTPRTDRPVRRARKGNRWVAVAVLVLLVFGAGFIIKQALGTATLFYLNADEAVAQKADLGTKRFRLQGIVSTPFENLGADDGQPLIFAVQYNGATVVVHHDGAEPPPLSKPGLPVVLEGRWDPNGKWFDSERLLVKHTEDYKKANDKDYEKEHPDRVKEASENAGAQ
jgi:cytochrome c-type biogenesis protein CcmE